jgi:hypothetical protein
MAAECGLHVQIHILYLHVGFYSYLGKMAAVHDMF